MTEFEIIRRYFARRARTAVLGVGDDCALVRPRAGATLAVSADMLLSGRHFFPGADPESLGHKALAVNLSDLAAMGADPRWALLAIGLPKADRKWIAAFARVLLCGRFSTEAVRRRHEGPLPRLDLVIGECRQNRRCGATRARDIWLSGATGEAASLARLGGAWRTAPRASLPRRCTRRSARELGAPCAAARRDRRLRRTARRPRAHPQASASPPAALGGLPRTRDPECRTRRSRDCVLAAATTTNSCSPRRGPGAPIAASEGRIGAIVPGRPGAAAGRRRAPSRSPHGLRSLRMIRGRATVHARAPRARHRTRPGTGLAPLGPARPELCSPSRSTAARRWLDPLELFGDRLSSPSACGPAGAPAATSASPTTAR